ncbi:MAG: type II methionyl aminopeptidase [Planctomycetota bacterium]
MNEEGLEKTRRAGRIASRCREWARDAIRPGVRLRDVLETIESMIREDGAQPAFPAQASRNECAAHYCTSPEDEMTFEEGDVVKIDMGVHVDGWIADTACTVDLSDGGDNAELVGASADALAAAIALVEPGRPVAEIGAAVERTITKAGYQPIRNLTGHGLDRWKVHCAPQIPNYGERGGGRLAEGMVVAIEPFACTGRGFIHEAGRAEVFMLVGPPRKAKGIDKSVLRAMQSWRGLPIARRYFGEFERELVDDTISKLARQGALVRYPPLVEEPGVLVAQTEHTLFVGSDGVEIITA